MKKILITLSYISLLFACNSSSGSSPLVLNYTDFGPVAMSESLLGQSLPQWLPHGESRPKSYDIKVVVYKSNNLQKVKDKYPVSIENNTDYRYISYSITMSYLDKHIAEDIVSSTTEKLKDTKQKLLAHFTK